MPMASMIHSHEKGNFNFQQSSLKIRVGQINSLYNVTTFDHFYTLYAIDSVKHPLVPYLGVA